MPDLNGDLSKVGEDTTLGYRVQRILNSTYHAPYDKLTQGWFHNYLNIKTASLENVSSLVMFVLYFPLVLIKWICGRIIVMYSTWLFLFPTLDFLLNFCHPQVSRGLDWAGFTDIQLSEVGHSQSWSLMAYLPFACVSYHLLFATHQWYKIQFPTQMNEVIYG